LKLIFGGDGEVVNEERTAMVPAQPATLEVGMTSADFSNKNLGVGGAIITSAWITHQDNGALLSVNLLENDIGTDQAEVLAIILKEHPALKSLCGNKGDETELDMRGKEMGAEGAIMLAAEIVDNRALMSLDLSSNKLTGNYGLGDMSGNTELSAVIRPNHTPDISFAGITALTNAIPDMGAISSVNLLLNEIGVDQAEDLVGILKEHPTLKSLCGNKGNETELDMSGKMRGAGDAIMLVPDIIDNGALTSLSLGSNGLGIEGAKIIAAVLPMCM
jgi:hypothetical protein